MHLTTGRVLSQYQSGAQTRRITSRRGEAVVPARLVTTIRPDTVFVPFHWGRVERVNTLTNPALDPTSRMPEFKTCAVRLKRAGGAP